MPITPSFNTTLDIDAQSATTGKFVFTDDFDYVGAGIALVDVTGAFTLTYPDLTQRIGDINTPDIVGNVSLVFDTLSIPLDAGGDYMEGSYIFEYTVKVVGGVSPGTSTTTINFSFTNQIPNTATISAVLDCLCATLTYTDSTNYGTYTTITPSYVVSAPATTPVIADETFNAISFVYSLNNKVTGQYCVVPDVTLTYVTDTVTVSGRLNDSLVTSHCTDVQCDIDLCGLQSCLESYDANFQLQVSQAGGFNKLPDSIRNDFEQIGFQYLLLRTAGECGNGDLATSAYNNLKKLLNCDCGCDSDSDTRVITALCAGGGNHTTVSNTDGNLVVTPTGSDPVNYAVNLSPATVALLASITTLQTQVNAIVSSAYLLLSNALADTGTTAAAAAAVETLKTYNWVIATNPIVDGDFIQYEARFTIAANTRNHTLGWNIFQGGSNFLTVLYPANASMAQNVFVNVKIERISAVLAKVTTLHYWGLSTNANISLITTQDLAFDFTSNFELRAVAQNNTAPYTNNDVICDNLKIEHLKII